MEFDFEKDDKGPLIKRIVIRTIIWVVELAIVIGLGYLFVEYTIERTSMIGSSMEQTLLHDDRIIINKFSYRFKEPKRYDVIVFKQEDEEHSFYNIKRIIGLPGETVRITGGSVYINNELLVDDVIKDEISNSGLAEEDIFILENEYFVLGDNRNNSEDSRFANLGNIRKDDIVGKAWIRMNEFDFIDKLHEKKEVE